MVNQSLSIILVLLYLIVPNLFTSKISYTVLKYPKISLVQHNLRHTIICVEFDSNFFFMKDKTTRKFLMQGRIKDDLYQLEQPNSISFHPQIHLASKYSTDILNWHMKLGHPCHRILYLVLKSCNQSFHFNKITEFCNACQYGKMHKLPFNNSNFRAPKPLELIHSDLWGPAPVISKHGFRYYINFLDGFSRYSWVYPLQNKSDALSIFKQFKTMVEKQFNNHIKCLY